MSHFQANRKNLVGQKFTHFVAVLLVTTCACETLVGIENTRETAKEENEAQTGGHSGNSSPTTKKVPASGGTSSKSIESKTENTIEAGKSSLGNVAPNAPDTTPSHLGTNGGFGGATVEGRSTSTNTSGASFAGSTGGLGTITIVPGVLGGTSNAGFGGTSSTSNGGVTTSIGGTGGTTTGTDSMTTTGIGGAVLSGLGGTSTAGSGGAVLAGLGGTSDPIYGGANSTGGTTQQPTIDMIPENRRFFTLSPWPESNISICYKSIDPETSDVSTYGAFVKLNVSRFWQRVANIQFTGWHHCDKEGGSINVEFTSKEASSSTFGFPVGTNKPSFD
jgi:hypothetical protein